jgi:hypothetical protein
MSVTEPSRTRTHTHTSVPIQVKSTSFYSSTNTEISYLESSVQVSFGDERDTHGTLCDGTNPDTEMAHNAIVDTTINRRPIFIVVFIFIVIFIVQIFFSFNEQYFIAFDFVTALVVVVVIVAITHKYLSLIRMFEHTTRSQEAGKVTTIWD